MENSQLKMYSKIYSRPSKSPKMITIKSEQEIKIMAEGGKILAKIMQELEKQVKPGVSTNELDRVAEDLVFKYGARPSFKSYQGFPASLCVAINEELVHVAPSNRVLKEGDIVSLDLGILYKGLHTDMAVTLPVTGITPQRCDSDNFNIKITPPEIKITPLGCDSEASRLIRVTKKALKRGIKKARAGNTIGDIGNTIQRYVETQGFNVVRDLCGHGIGRKIHEDPKIPNYGKRHKGAEIKPGMVFCIEPMVVIGDWKLKKTKDGFGFQAKDNSLCCHFEHTVAVLKKGPKVLTKIT